AFVGQVSEVSSPAIAKLKGRARATNDPAYVPLARSRAGGGVGPEAHVTRKPLLGRQTATGNGPPHKTPRCAPAGPPRALGGAPSWWSRSLCGGGRRHMLEQKRPGCQRPQCKQHKNQDAD